MRMMLPALCFGDDTVVGGGGLKERERSPRMILGVVLPRECCLGFRV